MFNTLITSAPLTSWTVWVTVDFPVLSWLFIGKTGKYNKKADETFNHNLFICLFITRHRLSLAYESLNDTYAA